MSVEVVPVREGDTVELRKAHPCGGRLFEVMSVGMDVRLKCLTCGSQIRLLRKKFGKMAKSIQPSNQ